ncbi:MAG TPA: GNAT family N-acetyltransferase [Ignavibacteria bacterium]|nr:GNAT family N-acetyltransferase [Ignavibacteria bacterium]
MQIIIITPETGEHKTYTNGKIADFLFEHLDQFGDKREAIMQCLHYVFNDSHGGFVVVGVDNDEIVGAVIVNKTGMEGYIPENILVYIAVNGQIRGKGIGKQLMNAAIEEANGSIALHVEPDNPAKFLYEKLGFTNKYLEMRLIKE